MGEAEQKYFDRFNRKLNLDFSEPQTFTFFRDNIKPLLTDIFGEESNTQLSALILNEVFELTNLFRGKLEVQNSDEPGCVEIIYSNEGEEKIMKISTKTKDSDVKDFFAKLSSIKQSRPMYKIEPQTEYLVDQGVRNVTEQIVENA